MSAHRESVVREIISTEVTYTESLYVLQENFRKPLAHGNILSPEQDQIVFLNVHSIYDLHVPLLEKLQEAMKEAESNNDVANICIGRVMLDVMPWLRLYTTYINGTQEASELVDTLYKKASICLLGLSL